jgi:peptidoglycan/xylan/chitin deacetylase (PgdA/CDA1 family)
MSSGFAPSRAVHHRLWKHLAGRIGAPIARAITHSHGRVLMYHRFGPGTTRRVDPVAFERQLEYLVRHFEVRPLGSVADALGSGPRAARQTVAVTVDDGYADFAEYAYPLLQRFGVPVTIFVVTRFLDGDFWLWFDAVHHLLHTSRATRLDIAIGRGRLTLDLSTAAARDRAWSEVGDRCLRMDPPTRQAAIARLQEALDVPLPAAPTADHRAMSWDQLAALDPQLVSVGSHTCTHPVLSRCSDADIAREVTVSRHEIARRLGRAVEAFCYPNGQPEDYDSRSIDAVRAAGYRYATVAHGPISAGRDAYTLTRTSAPFDPAQFERAVDGVTQLADQWRAWRFGTAS